MLERRLQILLDRDRYERVARAYALDAGLASEGIAVLASGLGLAPERVADGILELAAWSQANAVRTPAKTVVAGTAAPAYPLPSHRHRDVAKRAPATVNAISKRTDPPISR